MPRLTHAATRLLLARQRPMTSLLDKEIIAEGPDLVFDKANWVPLYFDRGHAVPSDCGRMTAFRAVTLNGQFLWMVFAQDKQHGYHAACDDPVEALEQARHSWAHRRAVRQDWDLVERTARDLILGRQRFDVRIEDAQASPLCLLGIDGFRRAVGLGRVTRMPGRVAALLMKIEPQMGFVIHAALQRQARSVPDNAGDGLGRPA